MARHVDISKMERVSLATMQLVIEQGYGNASVSKIAKKADVSSGYLYRFHKSKEDMVNALLSEKIASIIENMEKLFRTEPSIEFMMKALINEFFETAIKDKRTIMFLYVLMHDYSFQINKEQREQIKNIVEKIMLKGKQTGEVNEETTREEVYYLAIVYPIFFINLRLKIFFGSETWDESDINRVLKFCVKGLRG